MSEAERAEVLKAIQLELFALDEKYRDVVSEYRSQRGKLIRQRMLVLSNGTKRCRDAACASQGEPMSVEQFYRDQRYADHRYPYCIECKIRRNRASAAKRAA